MASINEVIARVNLVCPDAFDDRTKAAWLMELDGQIYRETILRHKFTPGRALRGPLEGSCPVCGGFGRREETRDAADSDTEEGNQEDAEGEAAEEPAALCYDPVMDCCFCPACRWSELPQIPMEFPRDGDLPLLLETPYDRVYDLLLLAQIDFHNREYDNYNNTALAFNTALEEWRRQYHRRHLPIGANAVRHLF